MPRRARTACIAIFLAGLIGAPLASRLAPQTLSKLDREDDRAMLRDALDVVKKHYYDPTFHGLDLDKVFAKYDERMQAAQSNHQAFTIIAGFLENLSDSHTHFIPPSRVARIDYGYGMQMVGDNCFVTRVRPGTDAAVKLHPGDMIFKREGYTVDRNDISTMLYVFQTLSPIPQSELDLQDISGQQRKVDVNATVREGKMITDLTDDADFWDFLRKEESEDHVLRDRLVEVGDMTIWKSAGFFEDPQTIERFFGIVRKHQGVIFDLRGNPGGSTEVLSAMLGHLFEQDVKIADRKSRKESKPLIAKSHGPVFSGKVVVLVDSESASAAELFARVVQLENRGVVVGDRSSGQVMEANIYPYQQGQDAAKFFDFEVTDADLIMKDGQTLEKNGVAPNDVSLPTAQDLAAGRDPVLAHAAELLGVKLDPAEAGKMFPFEWTPL
jgi:carboxyl-terminal processing protease